jgi:PAS domain S-box-containing protein
MGNEGIGVVDPRHLATNKIPPPVHIEQITANGKAYDASRGLRLPPGSRDLVFHFTALTFAEPDKVRFRVNLEGQDEGWRELVNQRQVHYTNLSPKPYRFRVLASNNSGVWNEEGALLDFSVEPTFYETKWFRALSVVLFLALLWGGYQFRVRQLRRQEKRLRDVIEGMPTMAFVFHPDGSPDLVNRRWLEYTGLSADTTADGRGWEVTIHPDDAKAHLDKWRAALASGEPFENEVRHRNARGEYRWFLVRTVPFRDRHGKIGKWYGSLTDIEDRKRSEKERQRLQRLEAELAHTNRVSMLGELAASLTHELNQPIAAAITSAGAALRWLDRDQPEVWKAQEAVKRIEHDGKRAADIIAHLKSFYKKDVSPQREVVAVNEVVSDMLVLLHSEAVRHSVVMRTVLAADLQPVRADRVQLQQVLMNLMLNGIEAMKEAGGELTIRTQREDGKVLVSVSDTGVGLPAGQTEQIFNAFVTTKPGGTGMGLAISRSIIEAHEGRLWAMDNEGRGASFHFSLLPAEM